MLSRRLSSWASGLVFASVAIFILVATALGHRSSLAEISRRLLGTQNTQLPGSGPQHSRFERVPCYGPRGALVVNNIDDQLSPVQLSGEYPPTLGGSHEALGLAKTWLSAAARYGPYGYRDKEPGYDRKRVNWNGIDWGQLQNHCMLRNAKRFSRTSKFQTASKLALRTWKQRVLGWDVADPPRHPSHHHHPDRTAIVIRSWETYEYTPEDLWYLRSMISEAALTTGGEYAVYLLVDIKNKSQNIHKDPAAYAAMLEYCVPEELRSIAILFDETLLESCYPGVVDHRPEFQIMQPLQLFAHFYADFDHYWQFEMDSRFTGHVGTFLDALSLFARQQPRKQARERASYDYIPRVHGTYSQFSASVNKSLNGGGLWGPDRIKDIKPIGPAPPTARPEDDNFYWGVGEDADLIVLKQCATVSRMQDWVYKDWVGGFQDGNDVPRTACPPAQARASWNLLNAIHKSQAVDALRVPSEATLPSWALWHGLKMILAPQPYYHDPEHDIWEMDEFWNGGPIGSQDDGMAYGLGMYNWTGHGEIVTSTTWVWASEFPSKIMDSWLDDNVGAELPYVMRTHDGHVMAPNLALHPRKTNRNP